MSLSIKRRAATAAGVAERERCKSSMLNAGEPEDIDQPWSIGEAIGVRDARACAATSLSLDDPARLIVSAFSARSSPRLPPAYARCLKFGIEMRLGRTKPTLIACACRRLRTQLMLLGARRFRRRLGAPDVGDRALSAPRGGLHAVRDDLTPQIASAAVDEHVRSGRVARAFRRTRASSRRQLRVLDRRGNPAALPSAAFRSARRAAEARARDARRLGARGDSLPAAGSSPPAYMVAFGWAPFFMVDDKRVVRRIDAEELVRLEAVPRQHASSYLVALAPIALLSATPIVGVIGLRSFGWARATDTCAPRAATTFRGIPRTSPAV